MASYIRELIMAGEMRSGEDIHIDLLARELGVSATPVREALMCLVSEGFLVAERHRGFTVAPLDRQDIEDIFVNHAQIGGELAARAAAHVTPDFITELEGLQDELERCLERDDPAGAEEANSRFHDAIINRVGSSKLVWLFNIGVRYVPRSVFYSEDVEASRAGKRHPSVADHQTILVAMRGKDPDKARAAMARHISHTGELLIEHLEKIGLWSDEDQAHDTEPAT